MFRSSRTPITVFLVVLGLLALCYNLLATFPSLTTSLKTSLQAALPQDNFCTKDIGQGVCCDVFMAAEPCVEQCREDFVDRETFELTQEYDMCAAQCLAEYTSACVDDGAREGAAGEYTTDQWL
ncbi:hypothetical protein GRF29_44g650499 [Pseudopithomyces chartarum]|jgi:hypothetical protein|uniref:Uncharacterized protein n=1 Tax=Pseudopithomyces chartarum TaxID=1892770 RepID=A0AAN6RIB3_9PLEO|nr:hypothetical protein GRF29_44g650499 [Pseudopithomyces chartarum]